MRTTGGFRRIMPVLGFLAVIAATGCSATSAAHPVAAVLNQPVSRPAASSPAATRSPSGAIQNLDVSAAVRSELIVAFAAASKFPVSYVQGTEPGSVYYAYDPATGTYWAMARFDPSATATKDAPADFQDTSNIGSFKRVGTGAWQTAIGAWGGNCGELEFFPLKVLAAWSLPTTPTVAGMKC